jgi:hypothetical protein
MNINASCTFDYKSVKALTHATSYRILKPKTNFILVIVLIVILILEAVYGLRYGLVSQAVILFVASAFFLGWNVFAYFFLPKMQYKALGKIQGTKNEYIFCEDGIKITSEGDLFHSTGEMKYALIPKVMETSAYLFIFQNKKQVEVAQIMGITQVQVSRLEKKILLSMRKKAALQEC